jgi:anti-sigma B factor antagonist
VGQDDRFGASSGLIVKRQPLIDAICLSVSGEVDLANAPDLLAHFKAVAQADDNLIVDLSALRYLDSTGIKALLDTYQQFAQAKRQMVLAAATTMVQKVLAITGVDRIVPSFPTVEEALSNIRTHNDPPLALAGS